MSVEPYRVLPLIGRGVGIHHSIEQYPAKIIFWCFGNPEEIVTELRDLGYGRSGKVQRDSFEV